MKNIKITIIALLLAGFSGIAQNKSTEKADQLFKKLQYVDAINAYNKLVEKGEADTYVYGRLAEANFNVYNTEEAERWYEKALTTSEDSEMIYNYAQMLKANGKQDASNAQMSKFAGLAPKDDRAVAFKANNDYLPKLLKAKPQYDLESAPFNSEFSDFGGTVSSEMLYFASARNTSRKNYKRTDESFLDVYQVSTSGEGEAETVNGAVNTKFHEGLVTFSPDGETMYFSRESFYEGESEKLEGDKTKFSVHYLYKATKNGDSWKKAEELPFNNNTYSLRDPSLSADGTTLYFASNMPNGFGMYDLYKVSVNSDGTFGEPENLGDKVNTAANEGFPYMSSNNTLYFSSTGHLGLGGLDVFELKDGAIKNLGQPVNSNADDLAFTIDEESGDGFVSSNREGGKGNDDIYKIARIKPCYTEVFATVVDQMTNNPIAGAELEIKDVDGNVVSKETTGVDGTVTYKTFCETALSLSASKTDYESNSMSYTTSKSAEDKVQVALQPIEKLIVADEVVLNPILFDFDKSNINAQAAFELDKLVAVMTKYPTLVIFAKSHTDYKGKDAYNLKLSERRAQSTVQYVISKGIAKERITGQGFGETEPKVDCGRKCTDEERQLNRRSEFKIVSGGPQK
jgi:outer membrane protein OmpA-like peptidoglycan-associated protein/tetratricopeptide (TPR) repeat protein